MYLVEPNTWFDCTLNSNCKWNKNILNQSQVSVYTTRIQTVFAYVLVSIDNVECLFATLGGGEVGGDGDGVTIAP